MVFFLPVCHLEQYTLRQQTHSMRVLSLTPYVDCYLYVHQSDKGMNFVGARRDLREALEEMDDSHLKKCLSEEGFDCIVVRVNFPSTSQNGGVWDSLQCFIITHAGFRNSTR